MAFFPPKPAHLVRLELFKPAVEKMTIDTSQAICFWQMVPQTPGLVVEQHECAFISPAACLQRQYLVVDLTAVHGSQICQRSEGKGDVDVRVTDHNVIGHFVL